MQIVITGRHTSISERMHRFIEEKFLKIERFLPGLHDARVVIDERGVSKSVEFTIGASRGIQFAGHGEAEGLREAVIQAGAKMETQVRRHKEKLRSRRLRRQSLSA